MPTVNRVLPDRPMATLDDAGAQGCGEGLRAARAVDPDVVIAELEASGLRGRGGGGFPTGTKWRTVRDAASGVGPATVVVNAAEGEPGAFKDRAIIRANPYAVVEGALIAAHAVGAERVVLATKASFAVEAARLRAAVAEIEAAGWLQGVEVLVAEGPDEYLYGEETALLEALDGRPPMPRITPPYRRGVDEVVLPGGDGDGDGPEGAPGGGLRTASRVVLAEPGGAAPPTLVNNVETMANVGAIVAKGAGWFRSVGTDASPGTFVCTISGSTAVSGVAELPYGTSLREAIELVGGGPGQDRTLRAALPGVSGQVLGEEHFDTPICFEAMQAIGSSPGAGGFIVYDDSDDMAAVAAGASRFLAVESCGQCTPCKEDGLALAELLERLVGNTATAVDIGEVERRLATVADESRCFLANQHQLVVGSLLDRYREEFERHLVERPDPVPAREPVLLAELLDLDGGVARWDDRHREKQPDWTFDPVDSGKSPVNRLAEQ